jgi:hypothetical protein
MMASFPHGAASASRAGMHYEVQTALLQQSRSCQPCAFPPAHAPAFPPAADCAGAVAHAYRGRAVGAAQAVRQAGCSAARPLSVGSNGGRYAWWRLPVQAAPLTHNRQLSWPCFSFSEAKLAIA